MSLRNSLFWFSVGLRGRADHLLVRSELGCRI